MHYTAFSVTFRPQSRLTNVRARYASTRQPLTESSRDRSKEPMGPMYLTTVEEKEIRAVGVGELAVADRLAANLSVRTSKEGVDVGP